MQILIVDDERPIRDVLADVLSLEGFSVTTAADGVEALAVAYREPPDAVILDLMMPGMDGLTLLRAFRDSPALALVPVIVVSAVGRELDRAAHLAQARMLKPFDVDELLRLVHSLLPQPSSRS
jgi:two-component system, OmpR family, response regulator MprA